MARVKRGFKARRRRNKVLKMSKGFHFDRRGKFKRTLETVRRAMRYIYISRRLLKRNMRSLWITRISAATKMMDGSYSKFMANMKKSGCVLNRKMLSEIAARDFDGFKAIYSKITK